MCVEFEWLYFSLALRLVFGPGLRNRGYLRGEGLAPHQASSLEGQVSLLVRHLAANYQRLGCRRRCLWALWYAEAHSPGCVFVQVEIPSTEGWLYVQCYFDYRDIRFQIWNFLCHCHSSPCWWDFQKCSPPHTCTPTHSWSSESSHMPSVTNILDSLSKRC